MLFKRIELLNFASYCGEHAFDLACTPEKPVVIILGGTGFGKTSVFDAINWALYGADYEQDLRERRERKRNIIDYVNETALQEAESKQEFVEVSCTLYFEHNHTNYYIMQSLAARPSRDVDGSLKAVQTDRITALYEIQHTGNHKRLKYDTIFLDEILPNNVKDYFLFDGDRIYNLSNPGASQEVRDAIYRVVDLELIKNAGQHLTEVAAEYRREANKESRGELSNVEEKYNNEYERLTQLKRELEELREEEVAIQSQLNLIESKLVNLPDSSKLQGQRTEIQRQLKQVEGRLERAKVDLRSSAAIASLSLAGESVLELVILLDQKRQTGEIPKAVSQTLLKDLLKLQRCLCGTEFEEGDTIYQRLTIRLEAERKKSSQPDLVDLLMDLKTASDLVSEAYQQMEKKDEEIVELNRNRQELQLALNQIDIELDKLPKEDVAELSRQARERRDALISNATKKQRVLNRIENCENQIKVYEKQRDELSLKQEKVRKLQRRERLAQRAAEEIEKIYEIFAEHSRRAVEDLTIQEFKKFVRSASEYNVALSKDYELEVLDSNGNRALQRLSMGQSQCLSLSFITAISRVSEKNPPLVIDMPFGRLDRDVHHAVSTRLPQITSQLILFLIPHIEWNEVTAANLETKASHIYQLEFDGTKRQTQAVEM